VQSHRAHHGYRFRRAPGDRPRPLEGEWLLAGLGSKACRIFGPDFALRTRQPVQNAARAKASMTQDAGAGTRDQLRGISAAS